jgi:hypothetical protein
MRRFAALWPEREKVQPLAAQIAWTSHRVLMDRFSEDPGLYATTTYLARPAGRSLLPA